MFRTKRFLSTLSTAPLLLATFLWLHPLPAIAGTPAGIGAGPRSAALTSGGDEGPWIDPNGLHLAGDEGPWIDPNGLRITGDEGPWIDPNG